MTMRVWEVLREKRERLAQLEAERTAHEASEQGQEGEINEEKTT